MFIVSRPVLKVVEQGLAKVVLASQPGPLRGQRRSALCTPAPFQVVWRGQSPRHTTSFLAAPQAPATTFAKPCEGQRYVWTVQNHSATIGRAQNHHQEEACAGKRDRTLLRRWLVDWMCCGLLDPTGQA